MRKKSGLHKKWKARAAALLLTCALALTGCGKEQTMTGEKTGSIFDLFADGEDPFAEAKTGTEAHTGDRTEELPTLEPVTEDTQAPSTEDSTSSTETEEVTYATAENQELNDLFFEYFKDTVTANSLNYRDYIRYPGSFGVYPPEELTLGEIGITKDNEEEAKKELKDLIGKLEAFEVSTLTEQQAFDRDYLVDYLSGRLVAVDNYQLETSFSPMRGLQSDLPVLFTDFRFDNKDDVDLYISLFGIVPDYVHKLLEAEQERVDAGYGSEDCVLDQLISQCDAVLTPSLDDHFMIESFDETISELDFLTETEKEEYRKKNREAVEKYLIPTYEEMKKTFQSWKGKGQVKGGLCNFGQEGKDLYAYLLRNNTGSSRTPQEMYDYLIQKQTELEQKIYMFYFTNPDAVEDFMENEETIFDYLNERPVREIEDSLIQNVMEDYPEMDPVHYEVSYLNKAQEKMMETTGAYYSIPAMDDPDGSQIRVNGGNLHNLWETLAHEGYPGHMYQVTYYSRTNPQLFRRACILKNLGYVEGWAVYAAYHSLKYCDYNGSSYAEQFAELSQIEMELSYLHYGVVDLGIHHLGWTVDDVRNYLTQNKLDGSAAEELYATIVRDPSVYLSYSMGYYEMAEMRAYAEEQLGSKFNVVEYHKAVLDAGPCHYSQLKQRVDKYIKEHK